MGDALPVVDLGTNLTAQRVSASNNHTCAILNDNTLKCWGNNNNGKLGLGKTDQTWGDLPNQMGDMLPRVNLGTGLTVQQVATGDQHTCALLSNGAVKCWGASGSGQLGYGTWLNRGNSANHMGDNLPEVDLGLPVGVTVQQIAAGGSHTCALLSNGKVKCWGSGDQGQLGHGSTTNVGDGPNEMGNNLPDVDLGPGVTVQRIATNGNNHTCALLQDNTLKCWGRNVTGQLGNETSNTIGDDPGEMGAALPPVNVGTGRTVQQFGMGFTHTCALLDDATVKCWGLRWSGRLGDVFGKPTGSTTMNLGDNPGEMGDNLAIVLLVPPPPGITVTETGGTTTVSERGNTDRLNVVLDAEPSSDVVLNVQSGDTDEATVNPATLTFTPNNWDRSQSVTVRGVDDNLLDGNQNTTLTISVDAAQSDDAYDNVANKTVTATTTDNDVAGLTLSSNTVTVRETDDVGTAGINENQATFTVALAAGPSSDVVIDLSADDATEATINPMTLTFTQANWDTPQTITVTGVDDPDKDGAIMSTLTLTVDDQNSNDAYDNVNDATITLTTRDDELPTFTVGPLTGSTTLGEGTTNTAQFTVVLDVPPQGNVVIDVQPTAGVAASPHQLTFTTATWNQPQNVSLSATDDNDIGGDRQSTITVGVNQTQTQGDYQQAENRTLTINVTDNDVATLLLNHTSSTTRVAEAGTTDEIRVRLAAAPATDVVVDLTVSSSDITLTPMQLTFSPFNATQNQTVTVAAIDDGHIEGLETVTITASINTAVSDGAFNNVSAVSLEANITDDDAAGLALIPSDGSTEVSEQGTSDTFTVVLNAEPTAEVTVALTSSDTEEATVNPSSLTFDSGNWDQAQTVTVTGVSDTETDPNQTVTITATPASSDSNFANLTAQSMDVTVISVNGISVVDNVATTAEDTAVTIDARANDFSPVGPLTLVVTNPPAHGTAIVDDAGTPSDVSDDVIVYTPGADRTSAVTFAYSASAGGQTETATISVAITAINDAPRPVDDAITMDEDTIAEINVLTNDRDPETSTSMLVLELVSSVQDGTLVLDDQGTTTTSDDRFVFTPVLNVTRTQTFVYRITDPEGLSAEAEVTITVTPINDAPIVRTGIAEIVPGTPSVVIDALANDNDDDGDVVTMRLVTGSVGTLGSVVILDGGTPSDPSDDLMEYTPPSATWTGWDRIYYELDDGNGGVTQGSELVYVNPALAPVAVQGDDVSQGTGAVQARVGGSSVLATRRMGPSATNERSPLAEQALAQLTAVRTADRAAAASSGASSVAAMGEPIKRAHERQDEYESVQDEPYQLGEPEQLDELHQVKQQAVAGLVVRAYGDQRILRAGEAAYAVRVPAWLIAHTAAQSNTPGLDVGERVGGITRYDEAADAWELEVAMSRASDEPLPEAARVTASILAEDALAWRHHVVQLEDVKWPAGVRGEALVAGRYSVQDSEGNEVVMVVPEEASLVGAALKASEEGLVDVTGVVTTARDADVPELTLWYTADVQAASADEPALEVPQAFALEANYPNPFNPSTVIGFSVPEAVHVTLEVYNVLGERVAVVASQEYAAGRYEHHFDGSGLASGMYLYRMVAGDFVQVNRMILMK